MSRYYFVVEPSATGFAAYVPDLPGCVATGKTRHEVERVIREAIEFHVAGMREEGMDVPAPSTSGGFAEIRL